MTIAQLMDALSRYDPNLEVFFEIPTSRERYVRQMTAARVQEYQRMKLVHPPIHDRTVNGIHLEHIEAIGQNRHAKPGDRDVLVLSSY